MNRLHFFLIVIAVLSSCSEDKTDKLPFPLDDVFELKCKEIRNNNETGIHISLDSVLNDSRCPKGVICIWEGNARVRFIYSKNVQDTRFELNTHGSLSFPSDTVIDGYRIELIDLNPYPEAGKIIPQSEYRAEIKITEE
jgi:hypothetical protein